MSKTSSNNRQNVRGQLHGFQNGRLQAMQHGQVCPQGNSAFPPQLPPHLNVSQPTKQAHQFGFDDRLPYQFTENGDPQLAIPHNQARSWHRRVTKPPELDYRMDETFSKVLDSREEYISRMVKAVFNLKDIGEGPKSKDRAQFTRGGASSQSEYDVEATCRVLFDTVMDRCVNGYRGAEHNNKAYHDRAKEQDRTGNCQTRLENVISCLNKWKCACRDIMYEDYKCILLANHPVAYCDVKATNQKNNGTKAATTRAGKDARAREQAQARFAEVADAHAIHPAPANHGHQQVVIDPQMGVADIPLSPDEQKHDECYGVVGDLFTLEHFQAEPWNLDDTNLNGYFELPTPQEPNTPTPEIRRDGDDYYTWPGQPDTPSPYLRGLTGSHAQQQAHYGDGHIPANYCYGDYLNARHHLSAGQYDAAQYYTPTKQAPLIVAKPQLHNAQPSITSGNNDKMGSLPSFSQATVQGSNAGMHSSPKRKRNDNVDPSLEEPKSKTFRFHGTQSPQGRD